VTLAVMATDHRADEPSEGPDHRVGGAERPPGERIIRASWIGTIVMALTAIPAAIAPDVFVAVAFVVSMAMFVAGVVVFFWAYAIAVNRSRDDLIGIGGLFFLAGSAPRRVQVLLLGSLATEVVLAFATAGARLFTPLAFGILAPLYGLSMCGLWAAKHGAFPPRPPEPARPKKAKGAASGSAKSAGRTTARNRTKARSSASPKGSAKGRAAKRR
jgi:hypothetical protein